MKLISNPVFTTLVDEWLINTKLTLDFFTRMTIGFAILMEDM